MNLKTFDEKKTMDNWFIENMKASRPFSLFALLMTQAGTAAPTATTVFSDLPVMVQETPAVPVFARTGAGVYTMTLAGATFTAAKTPKMKGIIDAATGSRYSIERTSDTVLTIRTFIADGTATDGLLTGALLEIKRWD